MLHQQTQGQVKQLLHAQIGHRKFAFEQTGLKQACEVACAHGQRHPEELHDEVVGCTWRAGLLLLVLSRNTWAVALYGRQVCLEHPQRTCGRVGGVAGLGQPPLQ